MILAWNLDSVAAYLLFKSHSFLPEDDLFLYSFIFFDELYSHPTSSAPLYMIFWGR